MTIKELIDELGLKVFACEGSDTTEITGGYISDLLSDVMGNAEAGNIWITLQAHMNVVAIASLKELSAIILVKDISPDDKVIKKAAELSIPLLGSSENTFELSGKVYNLLNKK